MIVVTFGCDFSSRNSKIYEEVILTIAKLSDSLFASFNSSFLTSRAALCLMAAASWLYIAPLFLSILRGELFIFFYLLGVLNPGVPVFTFCGDCDKFKLILIEF